MHEVSISPEGYLTLVETLPTSADVVSIASPTTTTFAPALIEAFAESAERGMFYLATNELQTQLPAGLKFVRTFACAYLTRLCQSGQFDGTTELAALPPPDETERLTMLLTAPPMTGLEYLNAEVLVQWWTALDTLVRQEFRQHADGARGFLSEKNPLWRFVGRVTLHLAENKRDADNPFAFLATYVSRLSAEAKVQHEQLGRALQAYAGNKNKAALLRLLMPLQRAAERSALLKELLDSGEIYHALAWSPLEAHRFLQDIPIFEEAGLIVRVPDWWKTTKPARPLVNVQVDRRSGGGLGAAELLDFSIEVALDGQPLTEAEIHTLLESMDGLVRLKGKWVEIDRERLAEALAHWRKVEKQVKKTGISFFEGMRLLAGASLDRDTATGVPESTRSWTGLRAGPQLESLLKELTTPESRKVAVPRELRATLRPYQLVGMNWLTFVTRLGLGACLADDMGLGKTMQVIALLLALKATHPGLKKNKETRIAPSLLIVPASLIANWKAEIERFAPTLTFAILHPSETPSLKELPILTYGNDQDLVLTTYSMLTRLEELRQRQWRLVILDEAQAIKNPGTAQSRAAKELRADARIAMTGTPVENRLSDLWSLFDFLNPGLLGSAKAYVNFVKRLESAPKPTFQPLRTLVGPYILRRLKTDKRIISDLPDKTEVKAFCGLTRVQAALYKQAVEQLEKGLDAAEGMKRRGLVLAQLMRFKQICNHPDQLLGYGNYDPKQSGKFQRLGELCDELAQRQEKALIFTQFREIAHPLAQFLAKIFGREGLVLHGGIAVGKRRQLVEQFQSPGGPPFFVLSVKAGGTGLNLTAASQVIHFDRWWNPAVENQATDRAFRIGQQRNVLVHKFVCQGTVEERIDALISQKTSLVQDVVEGGEQLLTEMSDAELLRFVTLDAEKAMESS